MLTVLQNNDCTDNARGLRVTVVNSLGLVKSRCPDKIQPNLLALNMGPKPGSSERLLINFQ